MTISTLTGLDLGTPLLPGATKETGGDVEVVAGGADIWGSRDEFHFAQLRVTGDFTLSARLMSLTMADLYTKAGLMMRTSLAEGAEHAFLLAFGDNQPRNNNNGGLEFQSRVAAGAPCTGIYPPQPLPAQPDFPVNFPNVWLRLGRKGDVITAENSRDGRTWRTYCVHRQQFPAAVQLGLAVTSHSVNQTVCAVFAEIALSQS